MQDLFLVEFVFIKRKSRFTHRSHQRCIRFADVGKEVYKPLDFELIPSVSVDREGFEKMYPKCSEVE